MLAMTIGRLTRVSKAEAKKRFASNQPFTICPVKLRPGAPWNPDCPIGPDSITRWKEIASYYAPGGISPSETMWHGTIDATAWSLFYCNWASCNTGPGMGNYASYWIEQD